MNQSKKSRPLKLNGHLNYHAAYYPSDDGSGWYIAEVLDFPGTLSQGRTLQSARRMIRDALRGMAECAIELGKPLPQPNPKLHSRIAVFEEVIPLRLRFHCGPVE